MISFKSKHFPKSNNPLVVMQEAAIQFYALFSIVVVTGVMVKLTYNQPIFWFAIIGEGIALALGNFAAYVSLRNQVAEIFFVSGSYSLISVYEIITQKKSRSFPLLYANAAREGPDQIHIHFFDQIVILKREDWEEFDLIWNWLTNINNEQ